MEDMLKKFVNISLGMAVIARDKAKEIIDELVQKGKMSEEEGARFMDDLRKETDKSRQNAESEMRKIIRKVLEKMDIPTKEEFARLEKRVKVLEKEKQQ